MTILENVELCANGYTELQEVNSAQKIKLRNSSYATITNQYLAFTSKQEETTGQLSEAGVMSEPSAEIVQVVAINPRIAEMINLLEVKGRLRCDGHKALKIKPTMHDCIKKNSTSAKIEEAKNEPEVSEMAPAAVAVEQELSATNSPENSQAPAVDIFKVSKNEASAAKVEKYIRVDESEEELVNEQKEELTDTSEVEKVISPTVIESENARPVSREVPFVAPERSTEEVKTENHSQKPATERIVTALNEITSLGQLRECLARTAELKQAAEQAKNKETSAKESAERAAKETADSREQMLRTAEKIAAHQETLIAQAEQSNAQASIYEARRGELEAEKAEYQKAIDDMLAIIGDEDKTKKEKPM